MKRKKKRKKKKERRRNEDEKKRGKTKKKRREGNVNEEETRSYSFPIPKMSPPFASLLVLQNGAGRFRMGQVQLAFAFLGYPKSCTEISL